MSLNKGPCRRFKIMMCAQHLETSPSIDDGVLEANHLPLGFPALCPLAEDGRQRVILWLHTQAKTTAGADVTAGLIATLSQRASPIARAIVEAVLSEQLGVSDVSKIDFVNETVAVMEKKIGQMSSFMAFGILSLTLSFDASSAFRGTRFQDLPIEARWSHLERWRTGPIGPMQDFCMFWEKMSTFTYYCFREEQEIGHQVDTAK